MSISRPTRKITRPDRQAPPITDRRKPKLRGFRLGEGLPDIDKMHSELQDMMDVLLGRTDPPMQFGLISLMEVADAYFARASELTFLIQALEREGRVSRGSAHYRFRTGELRTFLDLAKRAADLGSRRITFEQLRREAERTGRSTYSGDDEE